jgi:acyl-CoA synthetase (AMP-forming)/AMP-acid ligase II
MASPVTHITGYLFALELPFHCGAPALMMERWDPNAALELIDGFGLTTAFGATPFLKELLDAAEQTQRRLPSLRLFPCGGASVPPDLIRRAFRATERCRAFRIYGATEVPMVTKGFFEDHERDLAAETDGRVTGYEVKIAGPDGRTPPPGEAGELRVRGPAMFAGYTDADETAKALDEAGFFRTGDLGVLRDSAIVVTGRLKDLIIRGGENLSPVEIESALERHPAVAEAAVVAAPHPRLGEGVAAFLRAAPGSGELTVQEVATFLEDLGLARQKFPERVEYLPDFPRTASGKVRKDLLREALGN